jgi:hypothetical protein
MSAPISNQSSKLKIIPWGKEFDEAGMLGVSDFGVEGGRIQEGNGSRGTVQSGCIGIYVNKR